VRVKDSKVASTPSRCHELGAECYAKPYGIRCPWLRCELVNVKPLRALVTENDAIWRGAVLCASEARIVVDPRRFPKVRAA